MTPSPATPLAGIGLKAAHTPALLQGEGGVDFVEVHAENLMGAGGPLHRQLDRLRAQRPLSVHGVGLSIGGLQRPDPAHLARLRAVLQRFEPRWFSEHLAWSSHGGVFFNDLLPLPYDRPTLDRVCAHVAEVQDTLGRALLLENPSTYVEFAGSTMTEAEFLAEVLRRTGCGLLLDVNNAYVSAVNHGRDPAQDLQRLLAVVPAGRIGEIHLAGFAEDLDTAGDRLLIDTHGAPIAEAVWALYAQAMARLGPVPTLIERDQQIPPLPVLAAEAARARQIAASSIAAAASASCNRAVAA